MGNKKYMFRLEGQEVEFVRMPRLDTERPVLFLSEGSYGGGKAWWVARDDPSSAHHFLCVERGDDDLIYWTTGTHWQSGSPFETEERALIAISLLLDLEPANLPAWELFQPPAHIVRR